MTNDVEHKQMLAEMERLGRLCAEREMAAGKRAPDHMVTAEAMQHWMDGYVEAGWPDWPYDASNK